MAEKSSETRPRRKATGDRVEFRLTGVLPGEARAKDAATAASEPAGSGVDTEERARWIAEAAYYRAEARGFGGGFELEDWVAAEADYEAEQLRRAGQPARPAH